MNKTNEILSKYTSGDITLEQANAELKEAGANLHLDPEKNTLTESEIRETVTGQTPAEATGMGLLDTGTGSLDKVFVEDGKLVDADCGDMPALLLIGGKTYNVQGDTLTD